MAVNVERRYGALRIIALIYKVVAILILIISVIGAVAALSHKDKTADNASSMLEDEGLRITQSKDSGWSLISGAGGAMGMLIAGIIGFLTSFAFGELISLLVSLEENTRRTAAMLEQKG